ncbi:hypothetical protein MBLNU459_g2262t1 [Dothideomycetes sp. NU459]
MLSSDEILEQAARDGSIDISEWPRVLENVLQKLHHIIHNDFPLPVLPPSAVLRSSIDPHVVAASPPALPSSDPAASLAQSDDSAESMHALSQPQSSVGTNKENTAPSTSSTGRPPVPSFSVSATSNPSSAALSSSGAPDSALPPDLLHSFRCSTGILQNSFAASPPYTIQRLAELVLYPRKHFRYLPSYLAALDRVVSVSSPVTDFPLPQAYPSGVPAFLANGDSSNGTSDKDGLGSDESLGGALLTPIPWIKKDHGLTGAAAQIQELRTAASHLTQGPNGAGTVETVSVALNSDPNPVQQAPEGDADTIMTHEQALRAEGAVTQGELLRQEQEAGVVPAGQETLRRNLLGDGAVAVGRESVATLQEQEGLQRPEEHPSARGPELIGPEDMGPQHQALGGLRPLDMEAAVGRAKSPVVEQADHDSAPTVTANPLQEKLETQDKHPEGHSELLNVAQDSSHDGHAQEQKSDDIMSDAS